MDTDTITATFLAAKSIWDKPSSLSFGKVGGNVPSTMKNVSVKNPNAANLEVNTVSRTGTNADECILDGNCSGATLSPGETCTVAMSINTQSYGKRSAELVVAFKNTEVRTVTIKLTAKAMLEKIYVKPKTLSFEKIVTSVSASQQMTILNTGYSSLNIAALDLTGDHGEDFLIDPANYPLFFRGGQECIISVTFTPGGVGKRTGTLVISPDAPKQGTVNVKLKGEGIEPNK